MASALLLHLSMQPKASGGRIRTLKVKLLPNKLLAQEPKLIRICLVARILVRRPTLAVCQKRTRAAFHLGTQRRNLRRRRSLGERLWVVNLERSPGIPLGDIRQVRQVAHLQLRSYASLEDGAGLHGK